jgi:hypothetical protein
VAGRVVLVPMRVEGVTLLVEATVAGGSENTSRLDRAQEVVTDAFDRARSAIVAVATSTVDTVGQLGARSVCPDEVQVKFGLKFAVSGSVIVAGASGQATLEVCLTYRHTEGSGSDAG